MLKCVNINHPQFKNLVKITGMKVGILSAKIGAWQEKNNTDSFPTLEELGMVTTSTSVKEGVSELFESNPELANTVYSIMGLNIINESEITYTDEEGNLCAKVGLTNTTKGTDWKIVKDFKGKPKHNQGGVDISISDKGVSMRRGRKDIKAAYGLVIPNNN